MKVVLVFILGVLAIDVVHATLHSRPQPYSFSVGRPLMIGESK